MDVGHKSDRSSINKSVWCALSKTPIINWLQIRKQFQNERFFLNSLQAHNRSVSQPEIRSEIIEQFQHFRHKQVDHTVSVSPFLETPTSGEISNTKCKPSLSTNSVKNEVSDKTQNSKNLVMVGHQLERHNHNRQTKQLQCDSTDSESYESPPPVPKPRKSVLRRRQNKISQVTVNEGPVRENGHISPASIRTTSTSAYTTTSSSTGTSTPTPPVGLIDCNVTTGSASNNFLPNEPNKCPQLIPTEQAIILPSPIGPSVNSWTKVKEPIKLRAKNSFRQFLKINKIASNKFLSMRLIKESHKKSCPEFEPYKSRKPTRDPPPPPILHFRPPAPPPPPCVNQSVEHTQSTDKILPPSDNDIDGVNRRKQVNGGNNVSERDDVSELYHDTLTWPETEGIYSSVEEVIAAHNSSLQSNSLRNGDSHWKESNFFPKPNHDKENHQQSIDHPHHYHHHNHQPEEDYYDDGECIYEELSSNDETIYEEYIEEENLYDNANSFDENGGQNVVAAQEEKRQTKRLKKVQKIMKRFHLNGDEIPINAGIIKQDCRGSKYDLLVRRGETVLILRMDHNPPGKWLAKNERSKIGFVDLDNVYFDTESIKAVITSFQNMN